jgi:hypothetical protein
VSYPVRIVLQADGLFRVERLEGSWLVRRPWEYRSLERAIEVAFAERDAQPNIHELKAGEGEEVVWSIS